MDDIVGACSGHIRYERVDGGGPRKGVVTEKEPLLTEYDSYWLGILEYGVKR